MCVAMCGMILTCDRLDTTCRPLGVAALLYLQSLKTVLLALNGHT